VDYARVKRAIAQAPDIYVLGEGSAIPRAFFNDLGLRITHPDTGAPRDFRLLWATTPLDQEALDRWVKNLLRANPQASQNGYSIAIVALPTSDTTATVARIPFIGIGNSVYFSPRYMTKASYKRTVQFSWLLEQREAGVDNQAHSESGF
jgi:hypothetical protein